MQRAHDEPSLIITQVHTTAQAIAEVAALGALILAHPLSVAIRGKTMLPHFHKIILVDVALMIIGTDAGTGRDGAIHQNGTNCYASLA